MCKDADKAVREGVLDLFAQWANQDDIILRFSRLPFTIPVSIYTVHHHLQHWLGERGTTSVVQEEGFFKDNYPDLWNGTRSQITRGHDFWRSQVSAMGQTIPGAQPPEVVPPTDLELTCGASSCKCVHLASQVALPMYALQGGIPHGYQVSNSRLRQALPIQGHLPRDCYSCLAVQHIISDCGMCNNNELHISCPKMGH